jgi:hypothetical protein
MFSNSIWYRKLSLPSDRWDKIDLLRKDPFYGQCFEDIPQQVNGFATLWVIYFSLNMFHLLTVNALNPTCILGSVHQLLTSNRVIQAHSCITVKFLNINCSKCILPLFSKLPSCSSFSPSHWVSYTFLKRSYRLAWYSPPPSIIGPAPPPPPLPKRVQT